MIPTHCGWCSSTHVANAKCLCLEPCGAGWCPATREGPSLASGEGYVESHPMFRMVTEPTEQTDLTILGGH